MDKNYHELNNEGADLMMKALECMKNEDFESATKYREEANKLFDMANDAMFADAAKMSMLYGEGRNFGIIYDVFEQNISKMYQNKEDKKVLSEALNLIRNNKTLKTQFDIYNALNSPSKTSHPGMFVESTMHLMTDETRKNIKEINEKLINTLRKSKNFDEMVDIDDQTMKCYEAIETLITTPHTVNNLNKITNAKATIIEHITTLPINDVVNGMDKLQSLFEDIANRKELPTKEEADTYKSIVENKDKERLFNVAKREILEEIEDIINEGTANSDDLQSVYEMVKEQKYSRKNPVRSISKLIEVKDILSTFSNPSNTLIKEDVQTTTEQIPSYALPYLINGDASGLTDEDIEEIDNWVQQNGISNVCQPEEEYPYFCTHPAFGKAADVFDCVCYF